MPILIPIWFYGFDSGIYFISSLIGFLLSFYFWKIRSLSSERKHEYLYFGFLILSIGLLSLSTSSIYSYLNLGTCASHCSLGILDRAFSLEDFSYIMYFGFSLIAYTLFVFAYKDYELRLSKIFVLVFLSYLFIILALLTVRRNLKLWYSYSEYFQLSALIMMSFIVFRTAVNFDSKKNLSSFLVMLSFGFIAGFHLLYLFSFIGHWTYVVAHASLLAGFVTLLMMVIGVKNR